jgi:hypothetical protein
VLPALACRVLRDAPNMLAAREDLMTHGLRALNFLQPLPRLRTHFEKQGFSARRELYEGACSRR